MEAVEIVLLVCAFILGVILGTLLPLAKAWLRYLCPWMWPPK